MASVATVAAAMLTGLELAKGKAEPGDGEGPEGGDV